MAGRWSEVEVHLEQGFPWTAIHHPARYTLLHAAASSGSAPFAARALAAGSHGSHGPGSASTALLAATAAQPPAEPPARAERVASVDPRCTLGCTPLWYAAAAANGSRSAECAQLLVDAGADVNASARDRAPLFHVAAETASQALRELERNRTARSDGDGSDHGTVASADDPYGDDPLALVRILLHQPSLDLHSANSGVGGASLEDVAWTPWHPTVASAVVEEVGNGAAVQVRGYLQRASTALEWDPRPAVHPVTVPAHWLVGVLPFSSQASARRRWSTGRRAWVAAVVRAVVRAVGAPTPGVGTG
jgi:hypothetical protein